MSDGASGSSRARVSTAIGLGTMVVGLVTFGVIFVQRRRETYKLEQERANAAGKMLEWFHGRIVLAGARARRSTSPLFGTTISDDGVKFAWELHFARDRSQKLVEFDHVRLEAQFPAGLPRDAEQDPELVRATADSGNTAIGRPGDAVRFIDITPLVESGRQLDLAVELAPRHVAGAGLGGLPGALVGTDAAKRVATPRIVPR